MTEIRQNERTERTANAPANARKALPRLGPNAPNALCVRVTRGTCMHAGSTPSICNVSRVRMGAFVAFVAFAPSIHAGLRAFAAAFAGERMRSFARAHSLHSIF
jgi:hypothetical protein